MCRIRCEKEKRNSAALVALAAGVNLVQSVLGLAGYLAVDFKKSEYSASPLSMKDHSERHRFFSCSSSFPSKSVLDSALVHNLAILETTHTVMMNGLATIRNSKPTVFSRAIIKTFFIVTPWIAS